MIKFNPLIPKGCPPAEATAGDVTLYRGVRKPPISELAFVPHAEDSKAKCDKSKCESWGLSVWVTMADVKHAQKIQRYMRKWAIAKGKVCASHGVLKKTGNKKQPNHHTFWKGHEVELAAKFKIVQFPLKAK